MIFLKLYIKKKYINGYRNWNTHFLILKSNQSRDLNFHMRLNNLIAGLLHWVRESSVTSTSEEISTMTTGNTQQTKEISGVT